jgi:hypothetical protein
MRVGFYQTSDPSSKTVIQSIQEDAFVFVSVTSSNAVYVASGACETGTLTHSILYKKRFYSEARDHLIMQQLKYINRTVKKAQATNASMCICFSDRYWWAGSLGEVKFFTFTDKLLLQLPLLNEKVKSYRLIEDSEGLPIKRNQGKLGKLQLFLGITNSVTQAINLVQLENVLKKAKEMRTTLEETAKVIVDQATQRRRNLYYAVALFKLN